MPTGIAAIPFEALARARARRRVRDVTSRRGELAFLRTAKGSQTPEQRGESAPRIPRNILGCSAPVRCFLHDRFADPETTCVLRFYRSETCRALAALDLVNGWSRPGKDRADYSVNTTRSMRTGVVLNVAV